MALEQNNEFDYARRRAAQQESANLQTQKDALARRQAQLGSGVRGALVKQEGVVADQSAQRLATANEGIDASQRAEERRIREIDEGRKFTTSEREASQTYGAGQADVQRKYQTGEREASQGFSSGERKATQGFSAGESALQRRFQTGEREAGQTYSAGQGEILRKFQTGERISGQEYSAAQAELQRKFASGERLSSQDFALAQMLKQQKYGTSERLGAQDFAGKQQQAQFGQQKDILSQQQDFADRQRKENVSDQMYMDESKYAQQQALLDKQLGWDATKFEHEKEVDAFNMQIAKQMADQKGPLESLFSNFSLGKMSGANSGLGDLGNYYMPGLNAGSSAEDALKRVGF